MKLLATIALCVCLASGCSKKEGGDETASTDSPKTTETPKDDNKVDKPDDSKTDDGTEPGDEEKPAEPEESKTLALVEFPNTTLEADVDQYVFAPNDSSYAKAHGDDEHDKGRFSWGIARVGAVGEVESELKGFGGDSYKIANAYIIPIAKGEQVAEGDIVVTSKFGNTLDRAYVMKTGDKIKANFIRTMPYKDNSADLKTDKYYKLSDPWQPGAPVGVRVSGEESQSKVGGMNLTVTSPDHLDLYTIIRVEGDRVLLSGHMGRIAAAPKAAIVTIPLAPEVKKGDKVTAVWDTAHFREGTFVKNDKKLGHYTVRFDGDDKDRKVPYGELLAGPKSKYVATK